MNVLVVEDDAKISQYIQRGMTDAGYSAEFAVNGIAGLNLAMANRFDLFIIELKLPELDGLSLINQIRGQNIDVPILILTGEKTVEECLVGLKNGGDDFLTKPFAFTELLARSQALLNRRAKPPESNAFSGQISIDLLKREASREGRRIELQSKEFALLEFFLRHEGQVISKAQILSQIWNYNFDPQTNVVDVLVCRLRNKIDKDFAFKTIETVRGVGYVFKPKSNSVSNFHANLNLHNV